VSKQPVVHEMRPGEHWQTLFTHVSPGLHVTAPQVTPPLELELDVEVEVEPVDVEVELDEVEPPPELVEVDVDPPPPDDDVDVAPVEVEVEPVEVEPLEVVPLEVEPVELEVEPPAPVPVAATVLPPQPAWASTAVLAMNRGIQRADCSRAMAQPPSERNGMSKRGSNKYDTVPRSVKKPRQRTGATWRGDLAGRAGASACGQTSRHSTK